MTTRKWSQTERFNPLKIIHPCVRRYIHKSKLGRTRSKDWCRHLSHRRFAEDIVIVSHNIEDLQEMLTELKTESERVGLKVKLNKTKVMEEVDTGMEVDGNKIDSLGKQNQTAKIGRRIRMTWAAVSKLNMVLRIAEIPIKRNRKVFSMDIMTLTIQSPTV